MLNKQTFYGILFNSIDVIDAFMTFYQVHFIVIVHTRGRCMAQLLSKVIQRHHEVVKGCSCVDSDYGTFSEIPIKGY